jgi:hypothetical protein
MSIDGERWRHRGWAGAEATGDRGVTDITKRQSLAIEAEVLEALTRGSSRATVLMLVDGPSVGGA